MTHMIEGKIALDVSVLGGSWHGNDNPFNGLMTADQALTLSGSNWKVVQDTVTVRGQIVPGFKANIRDTDNTVLGFVSDIYRPVQNHEAFSFVDNLIGTGEAKFNSAGVLFNKYNRPTRIFISAELKPSNLMGDQIKNYLVFNHSHDGLNAVKVFVTPVRVVCHNTLTMALEGTKRYFSTKHTGNIRDKMILAAASLKLYEDYIAKMPEYAEKMNGINLYDEEIVQFLNDLLPVDPTDEQTRAGKNALELRSDILKCYNHKEDLKRFNGTVWGMYQAVVDVIEHRSPFRNTKTAEVNREFRVIEGHPVIQKAQVLLERIKK